MQEPQTEDPLPRWDEVCSCFCFNSFGVGRGGVRAPGRTQGAGFGVFGLGVGLRGLEGRGGGGATS